MAAFLADECFSGPLLRALRVAGFDVTRPADVMPGTADREVLALALSQGRVILTEDTDFGELTVRLGLPTHGVIRVDLRSLDRAAQARRLIVCLEALSDSVIGALVTIEPTRARLRRLE